MHALSKRVRVCGRVLLAAALLATPAAITAGDGDLADLAALLGVYGSTCG